MDNDAYVRAVHDRGLAFDLGTLSRRRVLGMLGAYGAAMNTRFNGFGLADAIEVADEPMASLYTGERRDVRKSDNVVTLR